MTDFGSFADPVTAFCAFNRPELQPPADGVADFPIQWWHGIFLFPMI
jgi:hypothetical protein